MTTKVEKSVEVDAPISAVYNQWTMFEEFPEFMGGVSKVEQLDDRTLHWVAEIGGVRREWKATILEQVPDSKVAWAATEGATNAGAVYFMPLGADRTSVRLSLEYEPEGLVEKAGDALNIVEKRAEADLKKFKSFLEAKGSASGGWRGTVDAGATVGTPGVEAAAASEGDSGKAGISAKAAAAGVAAVAVGAAAVAAGGKKAKDSGQDVPEVEPVDVVPVVPAPTVPAVDPVADPVVDPLEEPLLDVDPVVDPAEDPRRNPL